MSNKAFALAAFNTAVVVTNAAHATKRGVLKAAEFTAEYTVAGATASKEAGVAFWAGMKCAHNYNKVAGVAADRLTPEDIEVSQPSTEPNVRTVRKVRAA